MDVLGSEFILVERMADQKAGVSEVALEGRGELYHIFKAIYNVKNHLEFPHFSASRGHEAAQAWNSTPTVGKERSATAPLGFAILQPPQRENKCDLLALFSCTIQGAINKRKEKTTRE